MTYGYVMESFKLEFYGNVSSLLAGSKCILFIDAGESWRETEDVQDGDGCKVWAGGYVVGCIVLVMMMMMDGR